MRELEQQINVILKNVLQYGEYFSSHLFIKVKRVDSQKIKVFEEKGELEMYKEDGV